MKRTLAVAIAAAITLQVLILTGMVAVAALPLLTGTEISVRTQPIDPRDLFRGNYARLGYDFSTIDVAELPAVPAVRVGEVVYVTLRQVENGLHEFDSASLAEPESGIFLRGRVQYSTGEQFSILYGIEAIFAPLEEALALEKELRERAIATLAVSASGRARIKSVQGEI
ncbi:MAG: GDYXXLXY domain-containing protein [Gammaproteobacteria bacterium]|nr:GDYXXLXY domain-containing protein [Gammaproteobacteria bacterium]MDP2141481.1 GDYXXLXY domain-containing protein [Gammaproteobacteria bacterium]MDP2347494.1 GDYXXLXY domain-containing protein [Gammaproteobacteria bacterium]